MVVRIVRGGLDPITRPALEYLVSLGVPAHLINRIEVDSQVGAPQMIIVTMYVEENLDEATESGPDFSRDDDRGHPRPVCDPSPLRPDSHP